MKTNILLTPEQLLKISRLHEELLFSTDFDLIYENHLLPGVVILLEGELQYLKTRILKKFTKRGTLIGWENIRGNKKSDFRLRIKAGSRIVLIGRSGINGLQEILSDEKIQEAKIRH